MAIAVASVSITGWTQSTTPSVNKPASTASGDILIVHMNTRGDDSDPTCTGWTLLKKQANGGVNAYCTSYVYYRVCDGSEGSSFTFTLASNYWSDIAIYRITGGSITGILAGGINVNTSASPSFAAGITPPAANSLLLILIGATSTSTSSVIGSYAIATSDPGGWTEGYEERSTSPTGAGASIAGAYATRVQSTATGNFSATGLVTPDWAGVIVAIQPATSVAYTITCAVGAFTLSGQAVLFHIGTKMVSALGSFVLSGQTVILRYGRKLALAVGAFVLTGFDALVRLGKGLQAAVGAFNLSGLDILFHTHVSIDLAVGSFVLSGQSVLLHAGKTMTAAVGSFLLTGQTVILHYGRKIVMEVGVFTLSGQTIIMGLSRRMTAVVGTFTLTGMTIRLLVNGVSSAWNAVAKHSATWINKLKS